MRAAQRKAHLVLWLAIAPGLAFLFFLALSARPTPIQPASPPAAEATP